MVKTTEHSQAPSQRTSHTRLIKAWAKRQAVRFGLSNVARRKRCTAGVPIILVDAHMMLVRYVPVGQRKEYWKRPEVWNDLKASFDKFFELCPDANGTRQRYVLYAYRCERWEVLNKQ